MHNSDYMIYVWAAYGIAFLILATVTITTLYKFRKLKKEEDQNQ